MNPNPNFSFKFQIKYIPTYSFAVVRLNLKVRSNGCWTETNQQEKIKVIRENHFSLLKKLLSNEMGIILLEIFFQYWKF